MTASLLLTRCRRDLFDTYTSLFQHIVRASPSPHVQIAQFQTVCSALQTLSCGSLAQRPVLWRLVLLAQHILVALPSHLLLPSIDVYLPLTLLAVMENREMTTLAEEVADPRDELLLHPIKPRAVELMEVGPPPLFSTTDPHGGLRDGDEGGRRGLRGRVLVTLVASSHR